MSSEEELRFWLKFCRKNKILARFFAFFNLLVVMAVLDEFAEDVGGTLDEHLTVGSATFDGVLIVAVLKKQFA